MTFPTHPLRKADLQRLLSQMAQNSAAPSADLRAARQWAMAASLLDEQGLTAEGRLVATKDPYLEATVTDWLIHFNLSSSEYSIWNHFVYQFLPSHSSFTKAELTSSVIENFTLEPPEKLQESVRILLKSYTDSQSISKHKFLTQKNNVYSAGNSDTTNSYTTAYLLAKIWEREFGSRSTLLVNQIIDAKLSLSSTLGVNREQVKEQIDILSQCEIVEQRAVKLYIAGTKRKAVGDKNSAYQVYRCWQTPIELLEKAFEHDRDTPNKPLIQSLGSILDDDDDTPDFSQFLEWASGLMLGGGSNTIKKLAS